MFCLDVLNGTSARAAWAVLCGNDTLLAHQFRQLAQHIFPFLGIRQWIFAFGNAFPAWCVGQICIDLGEVQLVGREVFFGVNRVDWALWDADGAIYALVRVNDQHVGAFEKAVHGTDIHTIGVFAADTRVGNDVCHGFIG